MKNMNHAAVAIVQAPCIWYDPETQAWHSGAGPTPGSRRDCRRHRLLHAPSTEFVVFARAESAKAGFGAHCLSLPLAARHARRRGTELLLQGEHNFCFADADRKLPRPNFRLTTLQISVLICSVVLSVKPGGIAVIEAKPLSGLGFLLPLGHCWGAGLERGLVSCAVRGERGEHGHRPVRPAGLCPLP